MSAPMNLRLLPLLRVLLQSRSVTQAAREIGVTQSAASQGLAKLREMLGDPLLVRIGGQMQLTPRAKSLAARVEAVAGELDDMFQTSRFNPQLAKGVFVVAAEDCMAYTFARPMIDLLRAEAPGIALNFIEVGADFAERMAAQKIDFALMLRLAVRDFTLAPLRYRTLRRDEFGILMDRNHPLAAHAQLSEADVARFPFVTLQSDALERFAPQHHERPSEVAGLWEALGSTAVRVAHVALLPGILRDADMLVAMPYAVAADLAKAWPLEVRKLSFGRFEIDEGIVWSPVFDADPAHAWFRNRMEEQFTPAKTVLAV